MSMCYSYEFDIWLFLAIIQLAMGVTLVGCVTVFLYMVSQKWMSHFWMDYGITAYLVTLHKNLQLIFTWYKKQKFY